MTPPAWALAVRRYEPALVLSAFPPLVLRERFGDGAQAAALAFLAVLWLARRLATGRWTRPTVLDAPALALLLTLPGAVAVARLPSAALSRAESLIFGMALAYALANAMDRPARAWRVAGGLLAAAVGLVAVALVGVGWLGKFGAIAAVTGRLPRLIGPVPHATLPLYGKASETEIHPNSIAALLILFLPLALGCLAAGLRTPAEDAGAAPPRWLAPLSASVLALGAMALVLTESRGAWAALALSLLALLARRRPVFWAAMGGAAAAAGAALAFAPAMVLGLAGRAGGASLAASLASRLTLWRESAALVAAHPLWGIGLNQFVIVHGHRPEYGGGYVYQGFPHAHNLLLQTALDFGLPGLVAVTGLAAALAWRAKGLAGRLRGSPLRGLALGLAFGLLAFFVHGLVDAVSIGAKAGFVPWAFAGALAGMGAGRETHDAVKAHRRGGVGR